MAEGPRARQQGNESGGDLGTANRLLGFLLSTRCKLPNLILTARLGKEWPHTFYVSKPARGGQSWFSLVRVSPD